MFEFFNPWENKNNHLGTEPTHKKLDGVQPDAGFGIDGKEDKENIFNEYDLEVIHEKRKKDEVLSTEITSEYLADLKENDPALFDEITRQMNEEAEIKTRMIEQDINLMGGGITGERNRR